MSDWIKVELTTPRKPEVMIISDLLRVTPDHAFGLCIRFWMWCDSHLVDGVAPKITPKMLDKVLETKGFSQAISEVGWVSFDDESLAVSKFDRHMSKPAKVRAEAGLRQKEHRDGLPKVSQDCHKKSVTKPLPDKNKIRVREEEDTKNPPTPLRGESPPPTPADPEPPPTPDPEPSHAKPCQPEPSPEPLGEPDEEAARAHAKDLCPNLAVEVMSPEAELAHAWTTARQGVGWRVPSGETYAELMGFFREKLRLGKDPQWVAARIADPGRDRTEKLWQFARRELEAPPANRRSEKFHSSEEILAAQMADPIQKRVLEIAFNGYHN